MLFLVHLSIHVTMTVIRKKQGVGGGPVSLLQGDWAAEEGHGALGLADM